MTQHSPLTGGTHGPPGAMVPRNEQVSTTNYSPRRICRCFISTGLTVRHWMPVRALICPGDAGPQAPAKQTCPTKLHQLTNRDRWHSSMPPNLGVRNFPNTGAMAEDSRQTPPTAARRIHQKQAILSINHGLPCPKFVAASPTDRTTVGGVCVRVYSSLSESPGG
jgi:hypothetical protein